MGDKEADALVQSGLAVLSASIDGASQATYERYRVGGSFDLALGNLERLQRAKDRGNISTLKLKWTFLINKFNEHELEIAKRRAADIGVEIIFSLMDMGDDLSWKSSFHPHPVRSAEATQESGPRVSVLPCSIDSIQLHPQLYGWCMNPFNLMVINWDGNVLPCCNAFGDEFSLGNLLSEDVETIWNGIKLCNCRRFIHHYGPPQNTVSLCEILPCPVRKKAIS
jgi:radical SAM protein with 4Fe4S-binding SPASM domain